MPRGGKYAIAAVIVVLVSLFLLPGWLTALIVVAALVTPVAAYLTLDPSQRRRFRRQINR